MIQRRSICRPLWLLLFCSILWGIVACVKNEAKALFHEAKKQIELEEYTVALLLLDSIDDGYPEEIALRREALALRKEIYAQQSQKRLAEIPLLLDSIQYFRDSLVTYLAFDSDKGEYYHREEWNDRGRVSLRYACDTLGFPSFEVTYYGAEPLAFESIAFAVEDSVAYSLPIPIGEALNYTSSIGRDSYQMLILPPLDSRQMQKHLLLSSGDRTLRVELLSREKKVVYQKSIDPQVATQMKILAQFSEMLSMRYQLLKEKRHLQERLARDTIADDVDAD